MKLLNTSTTHFKQHESDINVKDNKISHIEKKLKKLKL